MDARLIQTVPDRREAGASAIHRAQALTACTSQRRDIKESDEEIRFVSDRPEGMVDHTNYLLNRGFKNEMLKSIKWQEYDVYFIS